MRSYSYSQVLRQAEQNQIQQFDESILEHVVCPLSKTKLRYDMEKQELISDELNVAYPINNCIPNLIPHMARFLNDSEKINKE